MGCANDLCCSLFLRHTVPYTVMLMHVDRRKCRGQQILADITFIQKPSLRWQIAHLGLDRMTDKMYGHLEYTETQDNTTWMQIQYLQTLFLAFL